MDNELRDTFRIQKSYFQKISSSENALKDLRQRLAESEDAAARIRAECTTNEYEGKKADTLLQKKQKQLQNLQDSREFFSLTTEINAIKKSAYAYDERAFFLWDALEKAEENVRLIQIEKESTEPVIEQELRLSQRRVADLEEEIASLSKKRAMQALLVDPEFYARYEQLRNSIGSGAVPVRKESCSACFYPLSQQDKKALAAGKLIVCPDCYRFVYSAEEA